MVFQRLDRIELKQLEAPKHNKAIIFFKGQMWDAVNCIEEIISKAEKSIILIFEIVSNKEKIFEENS